MRDEAKGGSYVINDKGERVLAEAPTREHPDGNAPRPAPDAPTNAADPKAPAKTTKRS